MTLLKESLLLLLCLITFLFFPYFLIAQNEGETEEEEPIPVVAPIVPLTEITAEEATSRYRKPTYMIYGFGYTWDGKLIDKENNIYPVINKVQMIYM